jgi:hypothetical protein
MAYQQNKRQLETDVAGVADTVRLLGLSVLCCTTSES